MRNAEPHLELSVVLDISPLSFKYKDIFEYGEAVEVGVVKLVQLEIPP